MAEPVLKLGRWNGTAIDAGEIWRLRNASRVASCHLWTHPKGERCAGALTPSVNAPIHVLLPCRTATPILKGAQGWEALRNSSVIE